MRREERPLWRCPACGHAFVTKNLWHSCGNYTLDKFERAYVHSFLLRRPEDLTPALVKRLGRAYRIGCQEHLPSKK